VACDAVASPFTAAQTSDAGSVFRQLRLSISAQYAYCYCALRPCLSHSERKEALRRAAISSIVMNIRSTRDRLSSRGNSVGLVMAGRRGLVQFACLLFPIVVAAPSRAQSEAVSEWRQKISAQLQASGQQQASGQLLTYAHFPPEACGKGGETKVAFVIDRTGKLISSKLLSGSDGVFSFVPHHCRSNVR